MCAICEAQRAADPTGEIADEATTQAATGQAGGLPRSQRPETIEKFLQYYIELYDKHLKSPDWVARAMAAIGMAKIDEPRFTDRLLRLMDRDTNVIVQVAAWEALHARQDLLKGAQRAAWEAAGFRLTRRNALRGDMRLGLLGLIDAQGPLPANKDVIKQLFLHTNSKDGRDIRTLEKIGDILKRWRSPDIIRGLIVSMSNVDDAYRAELVLQRIDGSIPVSYRAPALPEGERGQPYYTQLYQEGTLVMWSVTQKRWAEWFDKQDFKELSPAAREPYAGRSEIMARGEKVTDTRDPKVRKDLELARFRLGQLDMAIAIDSTASMGNVISWIQRDVVKMMNTFEAISREPRMSICLYRDQGDQYVVWAYRLTENAARLATDLKSATVAGGGDVPEAVYDALDTLVNKQEWSGPDARKVVVVIGDAAPHEDTMDAIEKLVKAAVTKGFTFHCIKVRTTYSTFLRNAKFTGKNDWDPELSSFDKIASWGNGGSFWVSFMDETYGINSGTAQPDSEASPDHVIFSNMLKAVVSQDYYDRVEPFVTLLLNFAEDTVKETRKIFPPVIRTPGNGKPSKPKDPQATR